MPALFGGKWSQDNPVAAHMQLIESRPLLCEEDKTNNATSIESLVTIPSDGLPVALLVERGQCTFWEKALVAGKFDPVQYVVVYDNEISPQLVPMSSESSTNMSLLFVSYHSGVGKSLPQVTYFKYCTVARVGSVLTPIHRTVLEKIIEKN
jgi:hypothetical protein